jgi:thiol-disulfide isomerase/thioredoxin
MTTGAWVLIAAVTVALAFGAYRAAVDGRFRGTHPIRDADREPPSVDGETEQPVETPWADLGVELGERATFVQFSSAFCAPCRATRRILGDVAAVTPGVAHHEIDAELHLDVVRRFGILRTPTTLVLDSRGVEVARASGAPTKEQALAQVGALTR